MLWNYYNEDLWIANHFVYFMAKHRNYNHNLDLASSSEIYLLLYADVFCFIVIIDQKKTQVLAIRVGYNFLKFL